MNREQRREMRSRAADRVKTSKAFIVVTWDGEGMPIYSYSVEACKNPADLRHIVMQTCAKGVEDACKNAHQQLAKHIHEVEQGEKVEAAKEKRSEELGKVAGGELPGTVPGMAAQEP
jgi:predicted nucleic acid-binding Zn ribbon protein